MVSPESLTAFPTAVLTGATATGKTGLSVRLAARHGQIEIVNADSLLVYRGMDIGTAKPSADERCGIPHHLIDVCDPSDGFNAGEFVRRTQAALADIHARGKRALIVGGTGFWLKALLHGLWDAPGTDQKLRTELEARPITENFRELTASDPETALRIGINDHYRIIRSLEIIRISGKTPTQLQSEQDKRPPPGNFRLLLIDRNEEELGSRIQLRTRQMLDAGFVEEVKALRKNNSDARALQSVGYRQVCDWLDGILPEGRKIREGTLGLAQEIELATRQLVKKQRTFFRGLRDSKTWFTLDQDLARLEHDFEEIYS